MRPARIAIAGAGSSGRFSPAAPMRSSPSVWLSLGNIGVASGLGHSMHPFTLAFRTRRSAAGSRRSHACPAVEGYGSRATQYEALHPFWSGAS
jgi:hypothetical protein